MDLDNLSSAASIPVLSYVLWAAAAVALGFAIYLMVLDASANFVLAIIFWAATCGLGLAGFTTAADASGQARETSFKAELDESYSLHTDATLNQIRQAAKESRTTLLKNGDDAFEVRPYLEGSTLTFIRVTDGKAVEKIAN
ncbi:MAG TPA: hypothetical protein VF885_01665 [Arthrobacter sp.]